MSAPEPVALYAPSDALTYLSHRGHAWRVTAHAGGRLDVSVWTATGWKEVLRNIDVECIEEAVTVAALIILRPDTDDAWLAGEVASGRACGAHDRPLPCIECAS